MTAPARNLVNLHSVEKGYGTRAVLRGVTLGLAEGDRVGIVGRNGEGKSTLLRLIAGAEAPDAGTVTRTGGVETALLGQGDELVAGRTIRQELVRGRADHESVADSALRGLPGGLPGEGRRQRVQCRARRAPRGRRDRALPGRAQHADRAAVGRRATAHRARP